MQTHERVIFLMFTASNIHLVWFKSHHGIKVNMCAVVRCGNMVRRVENMPHYLTLGSLVSHFRVRTRGWLAEGEGGWWSVFSFTQILFVEANKVLTKVKQNFLP